MNSVGWDDAHVRILHIIQLIAIGTFISVYIPT